jgi:hypothetical protein
VRGVPLLVGRELMLVVNGAVCWRGALPPAAGLARRPALALLAG